MTSSINRDKIRKTILNYEDRSPKDIRQYSFIDVMEIVENTLINLGYYKDVNYRNLDDMKRSNVTWKHQRNVR